MEKDKKVIIILTIYLAFISLIFFNENMSGEYNSLMRDIIKYTSPSIAIYFGYSAIKYFSAKTTMGRCALFITLAAASWFIGDFLWTVVFEDAVVSIADIPYLGGYPLLLIGIFFAIMSVNPEFFSDWKKLTTYIVVAVTVGIIYFNVLPASWDGSVSVIENIATFGYPIMDLILMLGIILLLSLTLKGNYKISWIFIGIGAIIWFIGDIYYAMNYEIFSSGTWIDLTWNSSYVFMGIGLFYLKYNAEKLLNSAMDFKQKRKGTKAKAQ
ncbi:MAG: hypothetical protein NDI94_01395 [Candidatus Woesearchaeota archaeon]|nr:hypothetical protein [Candidatus Woesearchaeota archaeon]